MSYTMDHRRHQVRTPMRTLRHRGEVSDRAGLIRHYSADKGHIFLPAPLWREKVGKAKQCSWLPAGGTVTMHSGKQVPPRYPENSGDWENIFEGPFKSNEGLHFHPPSYLVPGLSARLHLAHSVLEGVAQGMP